MEVRTCRAQNCYPAVALTLARCWMPKESRTGATPEVLRCLLHARQPPDDEGREYVRLSKLAVVDIGLNATDGNEPAWKDHPLYGQRLDVVALDLEDTFSSDRYAFNAVNGGKRFVERFVGRVTDDVFVIEYPLGLSIPRARDRNCQRGRPRPGLLAPARDRRGRCSASEGNSGSSRSRMCRLVPACAVTGLSACLNGTSEASMMSAMEMG